MNDAIHSTTSNLDHLKHIKQSLDDIKMMLKSLPANIYRKDIHGVYQSCYFNALEDFAVSEEHFLNRTVDDIDEFKSICHIEDIKKNDQLVFESGKSVIIQEVILDKHFAEHTFLTHKKPLYDKNKKIIGLFGISIDITGYDFLIHSQVNTSAEKQNEYIDQIKHNLRTPCHGILGLSQMLYSEEQDPEKRKKLGYITESSIRLYKSLNESIAHHRELLHNTLKPPTMKLIPTKGCDLSNILSNITEEARKKGTLTVNLSLAPNLPKTLPLNESKIKTLLRYLLAGLTDLIETPSILKIESQTKLLPHKHKKDQTDQNMCNIQWSIKNKKPGEDMPYTLKQEDLAMATKLVKSIGGTLTISVTNLNHTVCCAIPFETIKKSKPDAEPKQPTMPEKPPKPEVKKPRILVIEDDKIALYFALSILKKLDCSVDMAMSGKDAKKLVNEHYDLILMDIALPDTTGFELIKFFKKNTSNQPKIIGITAHAYEAYQDKAKKLGFEQLLPKPLNHSMLKKLIAQNIKQKEALV
jgi:two-component system, OmpR family, aerobic respiration control sensor histidine kinase ArcB